MAVKKGPKPLPHCKHAGCTLPRLLSPTGTLHSFCEEHQREDWTRRRRLYTERKRTGQKAPAPGRPKANAPRATVTPRQQRSKPPKLQKPETLRLLLVDKRTGEALRVTGVVQERVALEDLRGDGQVYERVAVALVGKG